MRATPRSATLPLLTTSLLCAPLLSGCFFRVPYGSYEHTFPIAVRLGNNNSNVVEKLMLSQRTVKEYSIIDVDGGGKTHRTGKQTVFLLDQNKHRTQVKNLTGFLNDPALSDDWFFRPKLGAPMWDKLATPGTRGALTVRLGIGEPAQYYRQPVSNNWWLAINLAAYRLPEGHGYLTLYIYDASDKVIRTKQLPILAAQDRDPDHPDFGLAWWQPIVTYRTREGYFAYDILTDTIAPASEPPRKSPFSRLPGNLRDDDLDLATPP